jgi:carbamoyl-phosphate synthase large subunit
MKISRTGIPEVAAWAGVPGGRARVLVTGAGGNVAQGILKALAASGLASWVVSTDVNPCSVGLFLTDMGYAVPRADSPEFAEVLSDIIRREQIDIVLVGADAETLHLARLRASLEAETGCTLVVSPADVVARCHDKWLTSLWFQENGLLHPHTVLAGDRQAVADLVGLVGYPLVVKPRTGFASRDVLLVHRAELLEAACARFGDSAIVQEHVGEPSGEYTATAFAVQPGLVPAALVMHRELLQGTSVRVEPLDDPVVRAEVIRWAELLGGIGPLNFQFRATSRGPVCFEVNARFSGTMGVRYHFGYNDTAMAVRHFALGEELTQPDVSPGVVLRFWEEIFLPGRDLRGLSDSRCFAAGEPCHG